MKRSFGVSFTAILAGLGGLLLAAVGTLAIFSLMIPPPQNAAVPIDPRARIFGAVVGGGVFLVSAIWGVTTAGGLWKLHPWSRWSVLAFSGLTVFFGVITGATTWFLPLFLPPGVNQPENMATISHAMAAFYFLLALLGVVWLAYFNLASVRAQFVTPVGAPVTRRPLSITLIAAFMLFGSLSMLVGIFVPSYPAMLAGYTFTGFAARLVYALWAAASISIGVGLWRLQPWSRLAAIGYCLFGVVNTLGGVLLPGGLDRMLAAVQANMNPQAPPPFDMRAFLLYVIPVSSLIVLLPIWFLVRRKSAFEPPQVRES